MTNLWGHFKDGFFKSCDDVCGKKSGRRSKADTWWWNEEVKDVSRKEDAHKVMYQNSTENKRRFKSSFKSSEGDDGRGAY